MDASQIAAAARKTAARIRESTSALSPLLDAGEMNTARLVAGSWERFASEVEEIDRTS